MAGALVGGAAGAMGISFLMQQLVAAPAMAAIAYVAATRLSPDEAQEARVAPPRLRLPKGASSTAQVGTNGARVWIKRDHLRETPTGPKT